jgi:uncharacterized phage-associated protein
VPEPAFDRDAFEEVVLYIAWKTRDDERFGRTKVAKTLFWSDFTSYAEEGKAITGATYEHWENGPFPPVLYDVEQRLAAQGLVELRAPRHQGDEARIIARAKPTLKRLTGALPHFIDLSIQKVAAEPTWRVSDKSHEHPGWQVTRNRQTIPYRAVYISEKGPDDRDLARAEVVAREHGWL